MHSVSERCGRMNKIEEAGRPQLANARRPAAYCLDSAFMAAAARLALTLSPSHFTERDGWMCAVCITHHCDGVQRVDYGEEQNVVQLICFRPAKENERKKVKILNERQKGCTHSKCTCRCVTAVARLKGLEIKKSARRPFKIITFGWTWKWCLPALSRVNWHDDAGGGSFVPGWRPRMEKSDAGGNLHLNVPRVSARPSFCVAGALFKFKM